MGTLRWIGGRQKKTAQVNTITPASVAIGNTFTVTINTKAITFTATAGTVANVTAGLVALLNASTEPEFAEITWADSTTHITATADTAGKPFTQTSSSANGSGGAGHSFVTATATANTSPEDWNDAKNYDTGALPVNSDDLVFDAAASHAAKWNLGSLSGVTLTSLTHLMNFEFDVGLPELNTDGETYPEYRPTYSAISATTVNLGDPSGLGQGSGRFKLNVGTAASTVNVFATGSPAETLLPAFIFKGTHASNAWNQDDGDCGVALFGGETAVFTTVRIAGGTLTCGSGTTLGTVTQSGGSLDTASAITTKTHRGGAHVHRTGTVGTLTITDGTVDYRSSGTITTLTIADGGVFDAGNDPRALTVTNCTLHPGATLLDPFGRITFSNAISIPGGLRSVRITRGGSTNLQFS